MIIDLAFEGGGMKGIAFIGALQALAAHGFEPGRLLGTSAGSMFAAFLAAGYSPEEMHDVLIDTAGDSISFKQYFVPFPPFDDAQAEASAIHHLLQVVDFRSVPDWAEKRLDAQLVRLLFKHPSLRDVVSFAERAGMYDPQPLLNWIKELITAKLSSENVSMSNELTLAQFYKATGRAFTLIAADMTNPTMLILNHVTAPDCPLISAVHMAIAMPMLFPPVVWQESWGLYRGFQMAGHEIVDGALLSNFPIELLLSQQPDVRHIMGEPAEESGVLGLLLDETRQVPGAPARSETATQRAINDIEGVRFLKALISTVVEARDKLAMEEAVNNVVNLPAMGYDPYDFKVTYSQLQPLITAAYNATVEQLATHPPQPYSSTNINTNQPLMDTLARSIINYNIVQNIGTVTDGGQVTGVQGAADIAN